MFEFKPAYKALAARCLKIYYNGKLIGDWKECHSHKNGVYNWYEKEYYNWQYENSEFKKFVKENIYEYYGWVQGFDKKLLNICDYYEVDDATKTPVNVVDDMIDNYNKHHKRFFEDGIDVETVTEYTIVMIKNILNHKFDKNITIPELKTFKEMFRNFK